MKFLLLTSAAAALAASAAIAQPTAPQASMQRPQLAKVQTRADVRDRVSRMFARLDANRDGSVTQAEVDTLRAQRADRQKARAENRAQRRDPAQIFGRLDANKDGQITRAEADAAHAARLARKGGDAMKPRRTGMGLFDRADANKDGVITRAEFDAAPKPQHRGMRHAGIRHHMGGMMFGLADVNKDGRVSLAEAQQVALQHFDRVDLNRDGQVTREERIQARQQLRSQRNPG